MEKITAIVLAGGTGKRMNSAVPKQYLPLAGKPVLYYSLAAFAKSEVTDIILVTGAGEIAYCKQEIVEKYNIPKVRAVVAGGRERYDSVYQGLVAAEGADYVLIHDGARPLVTQDIIARAIEGAKAYQACVVGMPVKDTIKIADAGGYADKTPDRSMVWQVQTPQAFSYTLVKNAYEKVLAGNEAGITDDAMVVERACGYPVKLIKGSYQNIKITTPEDLPVAEVYLRMPENRGE